MKTILSFIQLVGLAISSYFVIGSSYAFVRAAIAFTFVYSDLNMASLLLNALVLFLIGLPNMAILVGIWRDKKWGWLSGIVVYAAYTALYSVNLSQSPSNSLSYVSSAKVVQNLSILLCFGVGYALNITSDNRNTHRPI